MSSSQSHSIQTLLEAEKEAAKIVQDARQYRTQRLKDARSEAQKEIESYKKSKEDEIAKIQGDSQAKSDAAQGNVDKETQAKLTSIQQAFTSNRDTVVKKLIDRVILVEPKLHRNLSKGAQSQS